MKIVYIHGLGGAKEASFTYLTLKDCFPNEIVLSPEVPHCITKAMDWLHSYLIEQKPDIVVASSMGAFLVLCNNMDIPTILINPAMGGYYDLITAFGMNYTGEFKQKRSDGATSFTLDMEYYDDLMLHTMHYELVKQQNQIHTLYGFFGTKDELFHHARDYEATYGNSYQLVEDFHSLSSSTLTQYVVPKIKEFLSIDVCEVEVSYRMSMDGNPKDIEELYEELKKYNLSHREESTCVPLGIFLESKSGKKYAGLTGQSFGNWFSIQYLWVSEEYRHKGIGSKLLRDAEQEAKARGCKYVFLDTFSFQAPLFYLKHGYKEVFHLFDYPYTEKRYYYIKEL